MVFTYACVHGTFLSGRLVEYGPTVVRIGDDFMRKLPFYTLPIVLFLIFCPPAFATTVDEVISMSEAGVSPQVILTVLDATDSVFMLSVDDVVALEEAGVDDQVILVMLGTVEDEPGKTDIDNFHYLQLSDEQFQQLFLKDLSPSDVGAVPVIDRQPEYYHSPNSGYNPSYVSTPTFSTYSNNNSYSGAPNYTIRDYNPGWRYSEYSYTYPGTYMSDRKYYRKTGVYTVPNPRYYIVGNRTYYTDNYYNPYYYDHYNNYPKYYSYHDGRYNHNKSYSKVRVKSYPDDDWYLSFGFNF